MKCQTSGLDAHREACVPWMLCVCLRCISAAAALAPTLHLCELSSSSNSPRIISTFTYPSGTVIIPVDGEWLWTLWESGFSFLQKLNGIDLVLQWENSCHLAVGCPDQALWGWHCQDRRVETEGHMGHWVCVCLSFGRWSQQPCVTPSVSGGGHRESSGRMFLWTGSKGAQGSGGERRYGTLNILHNTKHHGNNVWCTSEKFIFLEVK